MPISEAGQQILTPHPLLSASSGWETSGGGEGKMAGERGWELPSPSAYSTLQLAPPSRWPPPHRAGTVGMSMSMFRGDRSSQRTQLPLPLMLSVKKSRVELRTGGQRTWLDRPEAQAWRGPISRRVGSTNRGSTPTPAWPPRPSGVSDRPQSQPLPELGHASLCLEQASVSTPGLAALSGALPDLSAGQRAYSPAGLG